MRGGGAWVGRQAVDLGGGDAVPRGVGVAARNGCRWLGCLVLESYLGGPLDDEPPVGLLGLPAVHWDGLGPLSWTACAAIPGVSGLTGTRQPGGHPWHAWALSAGHALPPEVMFLAYRGAS